ncbi:MAG: sigma 54-interacting transcriptional regulator [Myxococcota bacterium]
MSVICNAHSGRNALAIERGNRIDQRNGEASWPPAVLRSLFAGNAHEGDPRDGRDKRVALHCTDRRHEEADGTTLLIDEVGDLSPEAQVRLLRFLDRGEASRLGSNKTRRFKVRVIGATLRNLAQEVNDGRFRRDLFFRLRGVQIKLPPLRQRSGGFDEVVSTLLQRIRPNVTPQLTRSARSALRAYNWPGNLRELRQVLNSAVASAAGEIRSLPVLRGVEAVEEFGTIFRFMARSAMSLPAEFRSQIRSAIHERRGLRGSATRQSKGSGRLHFGAARYDRERACAYALAEVRAARVSPRSARPG